MCGGREGGHSQPVVGRRMQPLVGSVDFVQGFEGSYRGGLKFLYQRENESQQGGPGYPPQGVGSPDP